MSTDSAASAPAAGAPGRPRQHTLQELQDLQGLHGTCVLLRLLTRRRRRVAVVWLLVLWAFVAVAPPSYEHTYPDAASRQAVIDLAADSPAMSVFMGRPPSPGSLGQVFAWETGTYVLWCAALLAVGLTASATRGEEESGLVELARGAGAGRWAPLVAPAAWVAGLLAVLSAGTGLLLSAAALTVVEMTVMGAWVYTALLLIVGLAFEAVTLVLAQLVQEPTAVRGAGLLGFAVAFVLRVVADTTGTSWLRWLTPLAWRDLVDPYGANNGAALAVGLVITTAAGGLAALLHHRRDTGTALLAQLTVSRRRRRVRGPLDLLARLGARSAMWWLASLAVLTVLFIGIGAAMGDALRASQEAAAALAALTGPGSIAATYLLLVAEFNVLLIVVAVVLRALGAVADERAGLTEAVLAQGVSRSRWYWARVADAAALGVVLLVVTAGATAAVAGSQFPGEQAVQRAWAYTLSQGIGMLAVLGVAFALVGLAPRLAGTAWAAVAWSAFTVFLGGILDVPRWLLDVSALGHVIEVGAPTAWGPLVAQGAVGVLGLLLGWWGLRRRPVPSV